MQFVAAADHEGLVEIDDFCGGPAVDPADLALSLCWRWDENPQGAESKALNPLAREGQPRHGKYDAAAVVALLMNTDRAVQAAAAKALIGMGPVRSTTASWSLQRPLLTPSANA